MMKVKGGKNTANDQRLKKALARPTVLPSMRGGGARAAPQAGPVFIKSKTHDRMKENDRSAVNRAKEEEAKRLGKPVLEGGEDSDSESGLSDFDLEVDEDSALAQWKAKRMAELKAESEKTQRFQGKGHGRYVELSSDEFLPAVCKSKYSVCAWYHKDFERCKIVDEHMQKLCRKHMATRFFKIDAEKAPFFVKKLAIKVLPTIVLFKDGVAVDRITGFVELGGEDDFKTEVLEKRLSKEGIIIIGDMDEEAREAHDAQLERSRNVIRRGVIKEASLLD